LASNHHTLRVPPPDVDREPVAPSEPTDPALVRALERSIKRHFLTSATEDGGVAISAEGVRRVRLVLKRFGETAFVAGVLKGDGNLVQALTVCQAGMDNAEDDAAMKAAGALILEDDDRPEVREMVETLIEQVREQPTPIAVHIHFDEVSFDDPSVRIVTHCLAESFFDQFGLEKSHAATDV
jgi:hypothetical protein